MLCSDFTKVNPMYTFESKIGHSNGVDFRSIADESIDSTLALYNEIITALYNRNHNGQQPDMKYLKSGYLELDDIEIVFPLNDYYYVWLYEENANGQNGYAYADYKDLNETLKYRYDKMVNSVVDGVVESGTKMNGLFTTIHNSIIGVPEIKPINIDDFLKLLLALQYAVYRGYKIQSNVVTELLKLYNEVIHPKKSEGAHFPVWFEKDGKCIIVDLLNMQYISNPMAYDGAYLLICVPMIDKTKLS